MENPSSSGGTPNLPPLEDLVGRKWVSLRQVSNLLEVTYQTVLRYITDTPERPAVLHAVRVGGKWRVYEEELRRFLDAGNTKGTGK